MQYSIPLALEDFVPVILSVIGLIYLARMISKMDITYKTLAYAGVILVASGGFAKAIWKLIYAVSDAETNITILDEYLFFGLSSGFTLLAFALWYGQRRMYKDDAPKQVWMIPVGIIAVVMGTVVLLATTAHDPERDRQVWFFVVLGVAVIFNFVTVGLAIRQAMRENLTMVAVIFGVNLLAIFVLQGLARIEDQTEALQWVEQGINTCAQAAFLFATWKLYTHTSELLDKGDAS